MLFNGNGLMDNTIYPLNELRSKFPAKYANAAEKYNARPHLATQHIPHLNCLWGDVVFLSPVHPQQICVEIAKIMRRVIPSKAFYSIPVSTLDEHLLATWFFKSREYDPAEVAPFNAQVLPTCREVPLSTKEYFADCATKQERPLWFVHVPHIFHKGSINVTGRKIEHTEMCG